MCDEHLESYFYLYNAHGDVTALITAEGTTAATYYYDAFGVVLEHTGEVNNSILYAGYQYDEETGMYYINARMYNPVTARFMQEDTYVGDRLDPLSLNLYTYGHNNPIRYVDPTGHFVLTAIIVGAVVGAVISAGMEIGYQKVIEKNEEIDWKKVGFEAVVGGVFGALGAGGYNLVGKAVGKAAVKVGIKSAAKTATKTVAKTGAKTAIKIIGEKAIQPMFEGTATDIVSQMYYDKKNLFEVDYKHAVFTGATSILSDNIGGYIGKKVGGALDKGFKFAKNKSSLFINNMLQNVEDKKMMKKYANFLENTMDPNNNPYVTLMNAKKDAVPSINTSDADGLACLLKKSTGDVDVNLSMGGKTSKISPSGKYDINAKPSGNITKITDKMDEATKRSLIRENEAAEDLARNGYIIKQNPVVNGTTRNPDYEIEGKIFDCYSPASNTKVRNVASTIEEKVIKKGQTNNVVLNLNDWNGDVSMLTQQLNEYPIEGLEEVIVVKNGKVISIYP